MIAVRDSKIAVRESKIALRESKITVRESKIALRELEIALRDSHDRSIHEFKPARCYVQHHTFCMLCNSTPCCQSVSCPSVFELTLPAQMPQWLSPSLPLPNTYAARIAVYPALITLRIFINRMIQISWFKVMGFMSFTQWEDQIGVKYSGQVPLTHLIFSCC